MIDYHYPTTGERIKKIRKERKISQKELARRIGVSQSAIALWENGVNTPLYNNLVALARELDTGISDLCDEITLGMIRDKLPDAEQPTKGTLELEQIRDITSFSSDTSIHDTLGQLRIMIEEYQELEPISSQYLRLNDQGKELLQTFLELLANNSKYSNKEEV